MSSKGGGGLGGFQFGRDEAVKQLYGGSGHATEETASDQSEQHEEQSSSDASYSASKSANNVDRDRSTEDEGEAVTTPTVEAAPAPPPKAPAEARVQFNNRIKPDRRRILDRYQRKHNTTMQAIVDQMVDEYLERRGLLPKDAD